MNYLKMHTQNKIDANIAKIATLFPACVTEAKDENSEVVHKIDFDLLRQELSSSIVEGREERYQFTWPDKKQAILTANAPINKTLRPCRKESVDFDSTENLYIEGDNLEALKLLQETYLGKIKMIYIDPPYNTGNDFVYSDQWTVDSDQWEEVSGQWAVNSETGERVRVTDNYTRNTESNGRFHTDWLNMMYPRLKLARDLLSDDGVIFISIDDREVASVQWLVKEIFGECNFVAQFVWKSKLGKVGTTSTVAVTHEYILCFAKNIENVKFEMIENHSDGRKENLRQWGVADRREDRPSMFYPISINGKTVLPIKEDGTEGRWRVGEEMAKELLANGELELSEKDGKLNIYRKFPEGISFTPYETLLLDEVGTTAKGAIALKNLGMAKIFDFSKPVELIKHFIKISTNNYPLKTENLQLTTDNCPLILDFFSGSATTAHAVMQLNAEDGGRRKFIMVQLPELTDEKSEAYKAGYKNICEIGKERIRRAGKKISEQWGVDSELNKGGKNGCSKLQGIADMAERNADCERDLFAGEETSKGGDVRSVRPDEKSGSFDSVKHSGGAIKEFNEGVHSVPVDSERVKSGAGDSASSLQGNRLSVGGGNTACNEVVAGREQNALYDESKTGNLPLTTNHCKLSTNHCPLDIGFRVLKIDTSNMEDVYYSPERISTADFFKDNIKADRTPEDLLFQVMLDLGILLSSKIKTRQIDGKNVFFVEGNYLVACFDENVDEETITKIAKEKPHYFVMRDSSMASDSVATNFEQIFATYSPDTVRKVL